MRIGVLGTGTVGETLGTGLVQLGHEVRMGSRQAGNEKAAAWVAEAGDRAREGDFADAAAFGEVVFNCTSGAASLPPSTPREPPPRRQAARSTSRTRSTSRRECRRRSRSRTTTPSASRSSARFAEARVVKTLNTVNAAVMVDPRALPAAHTMFLCGNDAGRQGAGRRAARDLGWSAGARPRPRRHHGRARAGDVPAPVAPPLRRCRQPDSQHSPGARLGRLQTGPSQRM